MKRSVTHHTSSWVGRMASLALVVALVVLTGGSSRAQGQGQGRPGLLFEPRGDAADAGAAPTDRTRKRGRRVRVNAGALQQADAPGGTDIVTLNLFDDVQLRARRSRLEVTRSGGTVWKGRLLDIAGEATFAVQDGVMSGTVFAGDKVFEILYAGDGNHEVRELEPSAFPTDDPHADLAPVEPDPQAGAMDAAVAADVAGDAASQVDVMVIWTPAARNAAGGTSAIQSLVNLAVANTNTAYANSAVTQRLRLVYAGELGYTEAGPSTDLNRMALTADGYLDSVHALRNTYGADVVTLLGEGYVNAGACGVGYLMTNVSTGFASNAFNLVDRTCAAGNLSYAHELGHNMGLQHDPANATSSGAYSYAYGYQQPSGLFRTVMAYACPTGSCPRLMYFANPSVSYNGMATGTATQNTALALNNTASSVANFRQAVTGSCSYSLGSTSTSVSSGPATASVGVTTASGCAWTAVSNAPWLSITSGASGSGNGATSFSVSANTAIVSRSGTLTVAGQTFTVNQAAATCGAFILSPAYQSVGAAGGPVSVTITGTAGCARTATSNASWITVTAGATGTGNGTVSLSVAANTAAPRMGTVTVGGLTFIVNQAAPTCGAFSLSPTGQSVSATGGAMSLTVTGATGCAFSATSNASWITVTGGATGAGSGTVSLSVAPNTASTARTGSVTVAGLTFTVTQAAGAVACGAFSLAPAYQSVGAAGGPLTVTMTGTPGCARTATSNASWIAVTSGATGTGSGPVSLVVAANTAPTSRMGTVTLAGLTFILNQAGAVGCGAFSLSPATQSVGAAGGPVSLTVAGTTGCARTATSNASWITVTAGAMGTGSGSVSLSVAANTTSTSRVGTVTVGGLTFTLNQAGATAQTQPATTCGAFTLSPPYQSVGAAGGSVTVTMTGTTGCARTATSNATWITVTAGATGTGSGLVSLRVAANAVTKPRTGTVTVAGLTFILNQAGAVLDSR